MQVKDKKNKESKTQYANQSCAFKLNKDIFMHMFLLYEFKDIVSKINSEIRDYKNILSLKDEDKFHKAIGTAFKFYVRNQTFEKQIKKLILQQSKYSKNLKLVCKHFSKLEIQLKATYTAIKSVIVKSLCTTSSLYKKIIQVYFRKCNQSLCT